MLRVLKKRIEIFFSSSTTIQCAVIGDQRVVALLAIEMPGSLLAESAEPQKFVEGPCCIGSVCRVGEEWSVLAFCSVSGTGG